MSKHTAGPWKVARSINGELEPFSAKGEHLLSGNGPLSLPTREANARVIGLAPILLEGLEELFVTDLIYIMADRQDDESRHITTLLSRLQNAIKGGAQ